MIFGFLLFPELEELDLVGPWEMITMWGQYPAGPDTCVMIAEGDDPVRCSKGMMVQSYSEYYPSGKRYGNFHLEPEAPEYLAQKG
jgi:hypothetical protein